MGPPYMPIQLEGTTGTHPCTRQPLSSHGRYPVGGPTRMQQMGGCQDARCSSQPFVGILRGLEAPSGLPHTFPSSFRHPQVTTSATDLVSLQGVLTMTCTFPTAHTDSLILGSDCSAEVLHHGKGWSTGCAIKASSHLRLLHKPEGHANMHRSLYSIKKKHALTLQTWS